MPDDNSIPLYTINFTIIGRVQNGVGRGSQYVWCQESNVAGGNAGDISMYWLQQSRSYCVLFVSAYIYLLKCNQFL